jgi:putative flavoprotein involved in K+ transport
MLENRRVIDVANVVWCTGFRPEFDWIDLPVFGADGYPVHSRGVVEGESALYFVGLPFLYSLGSSTVGGVGRDAEYIAHHIASQGSPEHGRISHWTRELAGGTRVACVRTDGFTR